jgi:hypothetical protein
MCEMINLFVPCKKPMIPAAVRALSFADLGEIQRDFEARYEKQGTILRGFSSAHCLCGFADWAALIETVRELMGKNAVKQAAAIHFWSGDRYQLNGRIVDPFDDELIASEQFPLGELVIFETIAPARRIHHKTVKKLSSLVSSHVVLLLKNGQEICGHLESFDITSEVGSLGTKTFVAAQVADAYQK